jgi:hypothetical protein
MAARFSALRAGHHLPQEDSWYSAPGNLCMKLLFANIMDIQQFRMVFAGESVKHCAHTGVNSSLYMWKQMIAKLGIY